MIKLVVFDMDDTLYPELDYVQSGFSEVASYIEAKTMLNASEITKYMELSFQQNRKNVFDQLIKQLDINGITISELVAVYKSHQPVIELSSKVKMVLKQLQKIMALAIVTDGDLSEQQRKVHSLTLQNYVDYIVFTDEWGRDFWKPHPKAFEHLMKITNTLPHEILYIGDNPNKDFVYQTTLGIHVVQFMSDGFYQNDPYKDHVHPKYKISDLEEIFQIIDTINHNV